MAGAAGFGRLPNDELATVRVRPSYLTGFCFSYRLADMKEPLTHEIYPNAPLEFVACEVRFPLAPALGDDAALPRLHSSFYKWLPIVEPGLETTMIMGPGAAQPPITTKNVRFVARDRRLGVLVAPTQVTVETTAYTRYPDFRASVERALEAVEAAGMSIPGIARVGMRYIDEVRVPGVNEHLADWTGFIDERLSSAATLSLAGLEPSIVQGVLQFELGDGQRIVVRYGAMRGQAVSDAPLRRRKREESGAYFLVDIDSFWTAEDGLPEFTTGATLALCDRLHEPVWQLFEAIVTERLRDEVLREADLHG